MLTSTYFLFLLSQDYWNHRLFYYTYPVFFHFFLPVVYHLFLLFFPLLHISFHSHRVSSWVTCLSTETSACIIFSIKVSHQSLECFLDLKQYPLLSSWLKSIAWWCLLCQLSQESELLGTSEKEFLQCFLSLPPTVVTFPDNFLVYFPLLS